MPLEGQDAAHERGGRRRRLIVVPVLVAAVAGAALMALTANATPIPIPRLIVMVTTKSGDVVRTTPVLVGGVAVPIDVDDGGTLGLLKPDIDVSVPLIALDELRNGRIVVPQIEVKRDPLAIASNRPAPPLRIDAEIVIYDLANGLQPMARIVYGFETPRGAVMPPEVRAKLIGPLRSGFIDPLDVVLETPGYEGPLKFNVSAKAGDVDASFGLRFDPLPQRVHVVEDPREDGLDVRYEHSGAPSAVKLDADAVLRRGDGTRLEAGGLVDGLPSRLDLAYTRAAGRTDVAVSRAAAETDPDLELRLRQLTATGATAIDAEVEVGGLPEHLTGSIAEVGGDVDAVRFAVPGGGDVGSLQFRARNWLGGAPAGLPEPRLEPDQYVAIGSRRLADGARRWRAAGRLTQLRSATFRREGANHDDLVTATDLGDGARPLRVLLDSDDRGVEAGRKVVLDAAVTPLPARITAAFRPGRATGAGPPAAPTMLTYDGSATADVRADARLAEGPDDSCGAHGASCLKATVHRLPRHLQLELPASRGTDYRVSHDAPAAALPDVEATLDTVPLDASGTRTWADLAVEGVPRELRARIDRSDAQVLRTAEFHGCAWSFAATACTDPEQSIRALTFVVRDRPARQGLPAVPPATPNFVSVIRRGPRFEATGRISDLRHARYRQRDENGDGEADGVLGVQVAAASGGDLDVHVDQVAPDGRYAGSPRPDATQQLDVHVTALPRDFSACLRADADLAPPRPPAAGADRLLDPCERVDVLGRDGEGKRLPATPLSLAYRAGVGEARPDVEARVRLVKADPSDGDRLRESRLRATVRGVPAAMRADMLEGVEPTREADGDARDDSRPLELTYDATGPIDGVELTLDRHRAGAAAAGAPADRPTHLETTLGAVPQHFEAQVHQALGVLRAASFRACAQAPCVGSDERLGALTFLVRNEIGRGALPPKPADLAADSVAVLGRGTTAEVSAHVEGLREVAFAQRDDDRDGEPDGTLGVDVRSGGGSRPFDALVDAVRGASRTRLLARVPTLPARLGACFRLPRDEDLPDAVSAVPLLAPCDVRDVLGHGDERPLPDDTTPLALDYTASTPIDVAATIARTMTEGVGSAKHDITTRIRSSVSDVPGHVHVDAITPRRSDLARQLPHRALKFLYAASAPIDAIRLEFERERADGARSTADSFVQADVDGVPKELSGEVDDRGGVVQRAEVRGCVSDPDGGRCAPGADGTPPAPQPIGRVAVLSRATRERGALPPRPDLGEDYTSVINRFGATETTVRVGGVRDVSLHQPTDEDGRTGLLGVRVQAGNGAKPFRANIDQVVQDRATYPGEPDRDKTTRAAFTVDQLPSDFSACLREDDEAVPAAPPHHGDPLLAPCLRDDVLGHGRGEGRTPLPATPLSVAYRATDAPTVTADLELRAHDPRDADREKVTRIRSALSDIPADTRFDVLRPKDREGATASRPLQAEYGASAEIAGATLELEMARAGEDCADPRQGRRGTCIEARIGAIPRRLAVIFDPDQTVGTFTLDTTPADGSGAPGVVNIPRLRLRTSNDGDPISVDAAVMGLKGIVDGAFRKADLDGTPVDEQGRPALELAEVRFDACPGALGDMLPSLCSEVGSIDFDVTNGPLPELLPQPGPDRAGTRQHLYYVSEGEDFRARGHILGLRTVAMRRLPMGAGGDAEGATVARVRLADPRANERLRLYVHHRDADKELKVDADVVDVPQDLNLCLRPNEGAEAPGSTVWCAAQPSAELALQARVAGLADGRRPDVIVDQLLYAKEHHTRLALRGGGADGPAVVLQDLGHQAELRYREGTAGAGPLISVVGKDEQGRPANLLGAARFALRTYAGNDPDGFPFAPAGGGGVVEAEADQARNGGNYLKLIKDGDAVLAQGAVQDVKQLELLPQPCWGTPDHPDARFPRFDGVPLARPLTYMCVRAAANQGRPLGLTVRTRDGSQILAIEDGLITRVPSGGPLEATISATPAELAAAPACSSEHTPQSAERCQPPLVSVRAPRAANEPPGELSARVVQGHDHVARAFDGGPDMVHEAVAVDELSQRIPFEQLPRDWGVDAHGEPRRGVRLKIGSGRIDAGASMIDGKAIRGGIKVELPQFLDIDSPYVFTCEQGADTSRCDGEKQVGSTLSRWRGLEAQALRLRVVGAEDEPLGVQGVPGGLGRVALLSHDFTAGSQAILTGPPAPGGDLASSGGTGYTPEHAPEPSDADLGLRAPSYLDARVWVTTDYTAERAPGSTVVTFAQVDTRSTGPLEAAIRLNGDTAVEDHDGRPVGDLEGNTVSTGTNRAGDRVAQLQLNVRDIPGLPAGQTRQQLEAKPTFRTRAELRGAGPRPGAGVKSAISCGNYSTAVFRIIHACLDTGTGATKWLNVNLSATPPDATVDGPSRTIEAVIDTSRVKGAEAEIRGYKSVFDLPGEPRSSVEHARFTAEAGLRLAPFQAHLELGGGVTHAIVPGLSGFSIRFGLNGDLALSGGAGASRRLLLTSDIGKVNVAVSGGRARVEGDLVGRSQFKLTWLPLFGLISLPVFTDNTPDHDQPPARAKLLFDSCDDDQDLGENIFFLDGQNSPFDDPAHVESGLEVAAQSGHELGFLVPAAARVMDEMTCAVGASGTRTLIDDQHPAPRATAGPAVDGTPSTPTTPTLDPPARPDAPQEDLVVPENVEIDLCGVHEFRSVRLEANAAIHVRGAGCDGRLLLRARDITIGPRAEILAKGVIPTPHEIGTPAARLGGGAGHHGRGGHSGISSSSGRKYGPSEGLRQDDIGAPGATGTARGAEVPGGGGGGVIQLLAEETIRIEDTADSFPDEARLDASGDSGGTAAGGTCADVGGGGGSGGTVELVANKVIAPGPLVGNSAHVMVQGGRGGTGPNGGGGGSGGRVRIHAISEDADTGDFHAEQGQEGRVDERACKDGDEGEDGEDGEADRKDMLESAAQVARTDGADETRFVRGQLDLRLRVIADWSAAGSLFSTRGAVCHRYGGTAGGLGNPDLNPPQDVSPGDLIDGDCATHDFGRSLADVDKQASVSFHKPTDGGTERELPDGYYGFYALGYRTFLTGNVDDMQDRAPVLSPVKLAVDNTPPGIGTGEILDTTDGCPQLSRCAQGSVVRLDAPVSDNFSGVASTLCTVRDAAGVPVAHRVDIACDPDGHDTLDLGPGSGLHRVEMTVADVAGNVTTRAIGKVWIDRTAPGAPTFTQPGPPGNNGTFRDVPSFTVSATDGGSGDSSGFRGDAIELTIDGAHRRCGQDIGAGVGCSAQALRALLEPFGDGRHQLTARAYDGAGHESPVSEELVLVVDGRQPRTSLLLSPAAADTDDGWRRTQPLLLFAVRDGALGSGVAVTPKPGDDLPDGGKSGVYYRIGTAGPFLRYDPDAPPRLPDGVHDVCFHAIDLAGQREADSCPESARAIKVDTTPPAPELTIAPAQPDGGGGWYRTAPTLSFAGGDAGSGVAASGIRYAIDDDIRGTAWRRYDAADKPQLRDGVHEVCWYATDRAGNVGARDVGGATGCQAGIRVDSAAPPAAELHLDPPSHDGRGGWYRTAPRALFSAADEPGGSGLAGVRYRVDGRAAVPYDPASPPRLGDGIHELCRTSDDHAGNRSAPRCSTIKVDTTAPTAWSAIAPASPDGAGGLYRTRPTLRPSGSELSGSGVERLELQLGDAPWDLVSAPAALAEGRQTASVRAIDAAGNVSLPFERLVGFDAADPQVRVGTTPAAPNLRGWFRQSPLFAAQATDDEPGSGVSSFSLRYDGVSSPYTAPVRGREGVRSAVVTATDRAGRQATAPAHALHVDLTAPTATPRPVPLVPPLLKAVDLPFAIADASEVVRVRVHVIDVLGNLVRSIPVAGTQGDGFRAAGAGSVAWDGRSASGCRVLPGLYHFRVQAVDAAGNAVGSTESRPFLFVLGPQ